MRLPYHPVRIDDFAYGPSSSGYASPSTMTLDDGQSHSGNVYFLSHFHADHMKGLTSAWDGGFIFCTHTTKALLRERFGAAFVDGTPSCAMAWWGRQGAGLSGGSLLMSQHRQQHDNVLLMSDSQRLAMAANALLLRRGVGGLDGRGSMPFLSPQQYNINTNNMNTQQIEASLRPPPRVIAVDFEVSAWVPFNKGGHVSVGALPEGCSSLAEATRRYLQFVFLPAHHIAGSAMILFPSSLIGRCLYTGDFRYDPRTEEGQALMESIRLWSSLGADNAAGDDAVDLLNLSAIDNLVSVDSETVAHDAGSNEVEHAEEMPDPLPANVDASQHTAAEGGVDEDMTADAWLLDALLEAEPSPSSSSRSSSSSSSSPHRESVTQGSRRLVREDTGDSTDGNPYASLFASNGNNSENWDARFRRDCIASNDDPLPLSSSSHCPSPSARTNMSAVKEMQCGIDHLFLDDTWLHLTLSETHNVNAANPPQHGSGRSQPPLLRSKLLTTAELQKAFRAVCAAVKGSIAASPTATAHNNNSGNNEPAPQLSLRRNRPFIIRVYIHNNFGKEHLLMHLAKMLGTTVVVDDARYGLARQCCDPNSPDADVDPMLQSMDIRYFTPISQRDTVLRRYFTAANGCGGGADNHDPATADSDYSLPSSAFFASLPFPPCCIEVVSMSGLLSDDSLLSLQQREEATDWRGKEETMGGPCEADDVNGNGMIATSSPPLINSQSQVEGGLPTLSSPSLPRHPVRAFGIIMSGWAKLKGRTSRESIKVFDIPYSLHTSPEDLIAFVRQIRPSSVSQLHYKDSRSHVLMRRVGKYLARPYANAPIVPIDAMPRQLIAAARRDSSAAVGVDVSNGRHCRGYARNNAPMNASRAVLLKRRGTSASFMVAADYLPRGPAVRIREATPMTSSGGDDDEGLPASAGGGQKRPREI